MISLTIYATKDGITDPDEFFPERDDFSPPLRVRFEDDTLGLIYSFQSGEGPPDWVRFLNEGLDDNELGLRSQSASAVLLMQRRNRLFGIAFGYAWHKLEDSVIDQRFGLRAALNAVEPGSVRSIDRQTFDEIHRQAREQAGYATELDVFGLDAERDLLREITGVPEDPELGTRVSGKDRLTVTTDINIRQIPSFIDQWLDESQREQYRERYPWIDNIAEIRSTEKAEGLDAQLIRRIQEGDLGRIWLAPPEIVDWHQIGGFQYKDTDSAGVYPDLAWSDYFHEVREASNIEEKHLTQDTVYKLGQDQCEVVGSWSLGRCIIGEVVAEDSVHVHTDRSWYRVSEDFANDVQEAVERLEPGTVELPPFHDEDEAAYNDRAAEESDGYLVSMDGTTFVPPGAQSQIEFCDLFGEEREIIHVKRFGRSRKLSHLFSQGTVSARAIMADGSIREEVETSLPDSHSIEVEERLRAEECEVNYAIVAPRGRELELPFFSKVNLKNAVELLRPLGFSVTFSEIENESRLED